MNDEEFAERLLFAAKVFSISLVVLLVAGLGWYVQYNGGWICPEADQVRVNGSCQPLQEHSDALANYSLEELRNQTIREKIMEEENLTRRSVRKLINEQASIRRYFE